MVNAKPPGQGALLGEQLLLGLRPGLLLAGLLWWFWRRGGMSALAELVSEDFDVCLEFSGRVSEDQRESWLVRRLPGVALRRAG